MKKLFALLLAVIMVMSLMAACGPVENNESTGSTGSTGSSQGSTDSTGSTGGNKEFSYPMDTDVTLTEWRTQNTNITNHYGDAGNFDALPLAGWLEEATGVKVEYRDDYTDEGIDLENMWNSKKYADIIGLDWNNKYVGGATAALEDEVIIPLNDVIDQYMPNFKAWMEANPSLAKECMTDDGTIYMIPNVTAMSNSVTFPTYYRADILADMGETEPTSIEGWYELLKKVKAQYPDMVPCGIYLDGLFNYSALAHAYDIGHAAAQNGFAVDADGKIYYQYAQDSAKEFVKEMAKWKKEGLLSDDWAVKTSPEFNKDMINGKVFMSAGFITGSMQAVQVGGRALDPDFQLKHLNTPSVNGVAPTHTYANARITGIGCAITSACKDVEVAARVLDYRWSEEGKMLVNFGKEGISYDMVDGKAVFKTELKDATAEGFPAHKESIPENDAKPWTTSESLARFSMGVWPFGMDMAEDYFPQLSVEKCCADYLAESAASVGNKCWDNQIPMLAYTSDEGTIVTMAVTDMRTVWNQYYIDCINGAKDIDETWTAFQDELKEAGLVSATYAMQQAYERWAER